MHLSPYILSHPAFNIPHESESSLQSRFPTKMSIFLPTKANTSHFQPWYFYPVSRDPAEARILLEIPLWRLGDRAPRNRVQYFPTFRLQKENTSVTSHDGIFWTHTVVPRFNEPQYNEVLDITNDIFQPSNSVIYGKEHRYITNPRYSEPNSPVPWHLVKSRFHLNYSVCRILKEESTPRMMVFLSRIPPSRTNQNLHHDSMA